MTKELSTGERLKAIQRRLGAEDDGILGPVTLTRIESLLDQVLGPPETLQEYSLVSSRKGLDQMVEFEISSESYHRRRLTRPIWPKGASGITIGVGYDLGYNPTSQTRKDWGGKIADADLEALLTVAGIRGESAGALLSTVQHIRVPLESAKDVFYTATLPKYAKLTRKAYPGVQELPADAQSMMLSLVYNRGSSMSGSRRREMKAIQPLVVHKDLAGIAEQIRLMKRLWNKSILPGLHIRRDKEADMLENARFEYDPSSLVRI